jgi:Tfp pilus assembly protein PilV
MGPDQIAVIVLIAAVIIFVVGLLSMAAKFYKQVPQGQASRS